MSRPMSGNATVFSTEPMIANRGGASIAHAASPERVDHVNSILNPLDAVHFAKRLLQELLEIKRWQPATENQCAGPVLHIDGV